MGLFNRKVLFYNLAGFRAAALGERIGRNEVRPQGETSPPNKLIYHIIWTEISCDIGFWLQILDCSFCGIICKRNFNRQASCSISASTFPFLVRTRLIPPCFALSFIRKTWCSTTSVFTIISTVYLFSVVTQSVPLHFSNRGHFSHLTGYWETFWFRLSIVF